MISEYITIRAILREKRDSEYTTYIWEDLSIPDKYITCIKLPNWEALPIEINDIGYLQYRIVKAGETTWYDQHNKEVNLYNYDGLYFHSFIKEREIIKTKLIKY